MFPLSYCSGAQKHFSRQTGQCPPPLSTKKAANVDQSDSSVRFAVATEDTPALGKDGLHLTLFPCTSGSDLLQPILVVKTPENRLGSHLIPRGNVMSLFLQWHRKARTRLWEPRSQARMGACSVIMDLPILHHPSEMTLTERNQKIQTTPP